MTPQGMQSHIMALAQCHDISVDLNRRTGGRAWRYRGRPGGRISIAPVTNAQRYAVALHELGHVLGRNSGRRLDREMQAWEWARANALHWDDAMDHERKRCLMSYVRWAKVKQARDRRGKTYITPTHPVWEFVSLSDLETPHHLQPAVNRIVALRQEVRALREELEVAYLRHRRRRLSTPK